MSTRVEVQRALVEGTPSDTEPVAAAAAPASLRVKAGPPPPSADAAAREKALARWVEIAKIIHPTLAKKPGIAGYVADVMEPKATATLGTRAGSWTLFLAWCGRTGAQATPLTEPVVADYLREAASAAATRGQKFLEAVAFAGYHLGLDFDHVFSARTRGIANRGLKRKRDTIKKLPFTVETVERWERELVELASDPERVAAELRTKAVAVGVLKGFLLWTIHGRLRFGDAARVTREPSLDLHEGDGYLETVAKPGQHKTGHGPRRLGRLLPMVCCARGVSGERWTESWLKLRRRAGLDAGSDGTLMPEILADWRFGAGRMTTTAGGALLKEILLEPLGAEAAQYGTHSAKATVLSWLAKAGVPKGTRRLLGGHAAEKDMTMLEYSRDALAEPLREIARLYERIRSKRFLPDATRSGRWAEAPEEDSDTSSQTSAGAAEEEEAADAAEATFDLQEKGVVDFPPEGLTGNRATKVVHRAGNLAGTTACGHVMTVDRFVSFEDWPQGWSRCRRPRCFPADVPTYHGIEKTA